MSVSAATTQGGGSSQNPLCCAKASRTKEPCKKNILHAGTYFCRHHLQYTGERVPDRVQAANAWMAQLDAAAAEEDEEDNEPSVAAAPPQPSPMARYARVPLPPSPSPSRQQQPSGSAMSVSRAPPPPPQVVAEQQHQHHQPTGYPVSPALAQLGVRFEHGTLKVPYTKDAVAAALADVMARVNVPLDFVVFPKAARR